MRPGTFKRVKEKMKKVEESVSFLSKAVTSLKEREIDYSAKLTMWNLHRLHKIALGIPTNKSLEDMKKFIWWKKLQKGKDERKYRPTKNLYSVWAKAYDEDANFLIYLEERGIKGFIKNVGGKEVLDYGCGTGRYAIPLAKKGARVTAIDLTNAMLKRAKEKAKRAKITNIRFQQEDILKYKSKKKFEVIISMLVLDHVAKLKKAVDVIDRASKVGTEVIISNVHPEVMRRDADPKTGRAQGYLVDGYQTDQFFHSIEEYVELFGKKGFVLKKIKELVAEEKPLKLEKFKKFREMKLGVVGIIYKFEKIK
jgi:2-polyprenyl-3-methyl-5-hydroxy-6-metoxy-1,4-benzoquinol methylase